jgi:hypothetical protein
MQRIKDWSVGASKASAWRDAAAAGAPLQFFEIFGAIQTR